MADPVSLPLAVEPTALTHDVARVVLELTSPLSVGSGEPDDSVDLPFDKDANGLPTVPGPGLAGALRAAWDRREPGSVAAVFGSLSEGWQAPGPDGSEGGPPGFRESAVSVSFAHLHGSADRPVRALEPDGVTDSLLLAALEPVVRQSVRIDARGVADDEHRGLFDVAYVARGHRFTLEIEVTDRPVEVMDGLLGLLGAPDFRLGRRKQRGAGGVRLVRLARRRFELWLDADREDYAQLPRELSAPTPQLPSVDPGTWPVVAHPGERVLEGRLVPHGLWVVGGGHDLGDTPVGDRPPDLFPYREAVVRWGPEGGEFDTERPEVVVPGTAIAGALRHRVAYHLACLHEAWAGQPEHDTRMEAVTSDLEWLFGHGGRGERDPGRASRVGASDIVSHDCQAGGQQHVTLDRFTGGAFDGHLFAEALRWRGDLRLTLRLPSASGRPKVEQALARTLEDIERGQFQLGAGYGRGHGWMTVALSGAPRGGEVDAS